MTSPHDAPRHDPETAQEALLRAGFHGRAAVAETLAALRALLDAAALASSGQASEAHRVLGPAAKLLEGLEADLRPESERSASSLLAAIAEALDVEIARWEERAQKDDDARAVLRAFLGLRELLWEFGVRREPESPEEEPSRPGVRPSRGRSGKRGGGRKGARVQRVPVEG